MIAKDLMTDAICVSKTDTLGHARRLMVRYHRRQLLVMEEDKLVGILTLADILSRMRSGKSRRPVDKLSVETTMNSRPHFMKLEDSDKSIVKTMLDKDISGIPILDGVDVKGMVTKEPLLQHFAEEYKGKFKVKDLMSSEPITVNPDHTVAHVMAVLAEKSRSRVIVERAGHPIGLVSNQDIFFSPFKQEPPYVDELMSNVRSVSPDDDAAIVAHDMLDQNEFCLPVVDKGLVGVITRTDYLKALR